MSATFVPLAHVLSEGHLVALFTCATCGAVVPRSNFSIHRGWHAREK